MKPKISIRKVLWAVAGVVIGTGMLTLLIAANGKKRSYVCTDVKITVSGVGESFYIDKYDIAAALKYEVGGRLENRPVEEINLAQLEQKLEDNAWIRDAELYFDSKNVLHVTVTERQPIARVFTTTGQSFYIDTAALRMPLLPKVSVRVPVVTNFPPAKRLNAKDSVVLNDVKELVKFISADPFWEAQIAQIDIVERNGFELVPTVGNHLIKIGTVENLEAKFERLLLFYKQVLSKTGFDKYGAIDVQFDGQVIGVHRGASSVIDSVQLQKNIQEMLRRNQILEAEKEEQRYGRPEEKPVPDSLVVAPEEKPVVKAVAPAGSKVENKPGSGPVKTMSTISRSERKPQEQTRTNARQPKAVMPKRSN